MFTVDDVYACGGVAGSGSDAGSLTTTATWVEGEGGAEGHYVVNGGKAFISGAGTRVLLLVLFCCSFRFSLCSTSLPSTLFFLLCVAQCVTPNSYSLSHSYLYLYSFTGL